MTHRDEGTYSCRNGDVHDAVQSVTVHVEDSFHPNSHESSADHHDDGRLSLSPHGETTVQTGHELRLVCDSHDHTTITWSHDRRILHSNNHVHINEVHHDHKITSTLIIEVSSIVKSSN